ncbi:uncharacterized protein LOC124928012 [Impatiens glandulifera]|uniref:uncharacterized protein LOC124928012 n=1 Tax=Impatiens glandulifera TaxID=253017 RepID=UPI001FB10612|nr:uncharacterized protein LOC124928012 [Impatiens glandulifera]XP_047324491.1 uncharacterized protein LOC124928012 [Impatiens glandulifera]XP_047324492.1 uncharacterized protein LOC124928012 [Impatiens glandulifera]
MSEDRQEATKSRPMLTGPEDDLIVFDELPNMFADNPPQVGGDPWFFHSSEDLVGVEHFLSEPKCNSLSVDDVLSFHSIVNQKCYSVPGISVVDYGSVKIEDDVPDLNKQQRSDELANGVSRETDTMACYERRIARDTCEDYLLDNEFGDEVPKASLVRGSELQNITKSYGCPTSALSMENDPLLHQAASDERYSLFDEMSIEELHLAFTSIFGRETTVTDKQWLKRRLSFGVPNSDLRHIKCPSNSGECKTTKTLPIFGAFFGGESENPLNSFIKTKPRIRNSTWETCGGYDSTVINVSSEAGGGRIESIDTVFSEQEVKVICSPISEKRLRKPPKRFIEESLEKNTTHKKRRCAIWDTNSNVETVRQKRSQKRFGGRSLLLPVKENPLVRNCIQVPFGEPVVEHEKKRNSFKVSCSEQPAVPKQEKKRASSSSIQLPFVEQPVPGQEIVKGHYSYYTESISSESRDEDNNKEQRAGKGRRNHHIYWSQSEVLKLVEGVSRCGVGRWSEIKKQLFQSSANRTSVDLKDKWRNLLRASCPTLQRKREVQWRRKQQQQGAQAIPKWVQERVRELAAMYPYPRKSKGLQQQQLLL